MNLDTFLGLRQHKKTPRHQALWLISSQGMTAFLTVQRFRKMDLSVSNREKFTSDLMDGL